MTPRTLALFPIVFLLPACEANNPPQAEPAATTSAPIFIPPPSKLRPHPGVTQDAAPGTGAGAGFRQVATDGREYQAGYDAHVGLAGTCKDQSCFSQRCPKLCSQWIAENAKSLPTGNHKNTAYLRCFGACLAGPPDAGAK